MMRRLIPLLLAGVVLLGGSFSVEATEAGPSVWPEGELLLASRPITFAGGSARVPGDAGPTLDALAAWLVTHDAAIVVEGHTSVGFDEAESVRVSRRRAERVREALLARGCAPERVTAVGLGSARMLAARGAPDEFRNRRVEFRLVSPPRGEVAPASIALLDEEGVGPAAPADGAAAAPRIALLDDPAEAKAPLWPSVPLLDAVVADDELIAPVFASLATPSIHIPLLDSDGPRLELLE